VSRLAQNQGAGLPAGNILGLDHFTLRTTRVIGLSDGPRPAFRFPGRWLYVGAHPVLHLVAVTTDDRQLQDYLGEQDSADGSGCVDHISLRGTHLPEMQQHLLSLGRTFRERIVPQIGEHQLFLEDPNGVTIELIFPYRPENAVLGESMPRPNID
jgi:catechol 2,3-dioxygenase-like lactoylglutathione lyase family enzyme